MSDNRFRNHPYRRNIRSGIGGMMLLELVMALSIFVVMATAMMVCLSHAAGSDTDAREKIKARAAASRVLDEIRDYASTSYANTYAYYNADPYDDPDGCYTAHGNLIALTGQESPNGTATVRIEFPEQDGHMWEDIEDSDWLMPRDLDGSGGIETSPVEENYILLPVRVVVSWEGTRGKMTYSLVTLITAKKVH